MVFYWFSEWSMEFSLYKKRGRKANFGMPKVLGIALGVLKSADCSFTCYVNIAELNGIVYIQY